jgi:hypothetical protein
MNNTQWFRLSITGVSGYLVRVETTLYFKDGTQTVKNGTVDTNYQAINVPYGFLLIRANANPNEKIYPSGSDAAINETVLRTYPNGEKETNHYITETTAANTHEKTEIFFERATGVAIESYFESRETSGPYETTIRETILLQDLTSSETPDFTIYIVLIVAAVALVVILLLVVKKLRTRASPEQAEQYDTTDYSNLPEQE